MITGFKVKLRTGRRTVEMQFFVALVPQQIMVLPMEDTGCVGSVHQVPKALGSMLGGKTIRR